MKILVTGASGLIGSALIPALAAAGHHAIGLRRDSGEGPSWNPQTGDVDAASLDGSEAIVHLAGANIGEKRWTEGRKRLIVESRVGPTRALAERLARLDHPPGTLIVASAIGIYGNRGEEWLDESAPAGSGFLADVVRQWEAACTPAADKGIRVVNLRFGIILTPRGGALARMLLPFKLGLGGPIGSGRQYWSWVGIDDIVGAVRHALERGGLFGPVNVVAPSPVTNREFSRTLARVLARPAFFPLPALAARLALGEMADELLMYSARVKPGKLVATNYRFHDAELEACLRRLVKS